MKAIKTKTINILKILTIFSLIATVQFCSTDTKNSAEQPFTDADKVAEDAASLEAAMAEYGDTITESLTLPSKGTYGSAITWESSNASVIKADGIVTRPIDGADVQVTLTATIKLGKEEIIKEFTFTVLALSSDASLSALTSSISNLNPAFAMGTTSYTLIAPVNTASIQFTPTANQFEASIQVDSVDVDSGTASTPVNLSNGENTIDIAVTAGDGTSTETYTITVYRLYLLGGSIHGAPLDIAGPVSTFAGTKSLDSLDGTGTTAIFTNPNDVKSDGTYLYVADNLNHLVRKIEIATGNTTTLAGTGEDAYQESTDGTGATAKISYPNKICLEGDYLYVSSGKHNVNGGYRIRKIHKTTGDTTTLAGSGTSGWQNSTDGTGATATFRLGANGGGGLASDGTYLFVADTDNYLIRRIDLSTGNTITLAGIDNNYVDGDGTHSSTTGTKAQFKKPYDLTYYDGYLYGVDYSTSANPGYVRKINASSGDTTTLASFDYESITGVTNDGTFLYITNYKHHTIERVAISDGTKTTLAGTADTSGYTDDTGANARFNQPLGIGYASGFIFVAETGNDVIRKIDVSDGATTTLAGGGLVSTNYPDRALYQVDSSDGTGASARFKRPQGITTDGEYFYISDDSNNNIRKVNIITGETTTLAGDGTSATLNPWGLTADANFLYVTDKANSRILKLNKSTGALENGGVPLADNTDGITTSVREITNAGDYLYVNNDGNIIAVHKTTGDVTTLLDWSTGDSAYFSYAMGLTTNGTHIYFVNSETNVKQAELTTPTTLDKVNISTVMTHPDSDALLSVVVHGNYLYTTDEGIGIIFKTELGLETTVLTGADDWPNTYKDGSLDDARFNGTNGIVSDGYSLYVVDKWNKVIRKIE
jgi:hypothetical protein